MFYHRINAAFKGFFQGNQDEVEFKDKRNTGDYEIHHAKYGPRGQQAVTYTTQEKKYYEIQHVKYSQPEWKIVTYSKDKEI